MRHQAPPISTAFMINHHQQMLRECLTPLVQCVYYCCVAPLCFYCIVLPAYCLLAPIWVPAWLATSLLGLFYYYSYLPRVNGKNEDIYFLWFSFRQFDCVFFKWLSDSTRIDTKNRPKAAILLLLSHLLIFPGILHTATALWLITKDAFEKYPELFGLIFGLIPIIGLFALNNAFWQSNLNNSLPMSTWCDSIPAPQETNGFFGKVKSGLFLLVASLNIIGTVIAWFALLARACDVEPRKTNFTLFCIKRDKEDTEKIELDENLLTNN